MRYHYLGQGVRLKGGDCTIHVHNGDVDCSTCRDIIMAGERFTVGMLNKDRPCCRKCQPFNEQVSLLDELPEPERARENPHHRTMEDYLARDGEWRHRKQCVGCDGKGWTEDRFRIRTPHKDCSGKGWIWEKGRVST